MKYRISAIVPFLMSLFGCSANVDPEKVSDMYRGGLQAPKEHLNVYHLGHSLVNKDMPYMLKQLAGEQHDYASQLGWGTPLRDHWEPDYPINGYDEENNHPHFRDVFDAIDNGEYDAFVLTEMVEIKDSIKYFESPEYLAKFTKKIIDANPQAKIYLYETWHNIDDPAGWVQRLDNDLGMYWESRITDRAMDKLDWQQTIYIIPAGQVFSAFFKQVEAKGGVGNIRTPADIFGKQADGSQDTIHLNDIGNYLVALVHYAVLYHKSPVGLPHELMSPSGERYTSPSAETADVMQKLAWDIVSKYKRSGVN